MGQKSVQMIPEDTAEMKAFLERVENTGFQKKLEEAASLIVRADRVIMVGIGNSGYIGEYAVRYFTNLGKFSLYITDAFYPINMVDYTSQVPALYLIECLAKRVRNRLTENK